MEDLLHLGEIVFETGKWILLDDIKDLGLINRIHHWQIGLLMLGFGAVLSLIGAGYYLNRLLNYG